jgi:signal peptidase I
VPEGACFVLGDNRDNSNDSRRSSKVGGLGFVPFDHIIGRVTFIYYSAELGSHGRPGAPRPERIGEWVR